MLVAACAAYAITPSSAAWAAAGTTRSAFAAASSQAGSSLALSAQGATATGPVSAPLGTWDAPGITAPPVAQMPQWPPAPPAQLPGTPPPPAGAIFAPANPGAYLGPANNQASQDSSALVAAQAASAALASAISSGQVKERQLTTQLQMASAQVAQAQHLVAVYGSEVANLKTAISLSDSASGSSLGKGLEAVAVPGSPANALQVARLALHDALAAARAHLAASKTQLVALTRQVAALRNQLNSNQQQLQAYTGAQSYAGSALRWDYQANQRAQAWLGLLNRAAPDPKTGIPRLLLDAYVEAASYMSSTDSTCGVTWQDLAAIGQLESGQVASGGVQISATGDVYPAILGPPLNGGPGTASVANAASPVFDGNAAYARAVGPMQFLPQTWASLAATLPLGIPSNPNNVFGAATAAAAYLCKAAGPGGMGTQSGLAAAYMSYNHSSSYVAAAMALAAKFTAGGTAPVPAITTTQTAPVSLPFATSPAAGTASGLSPAEAATLALSSGQAAASQP